MKVEPVAARDDAGLAFAVTVTDAQGASTHVVTTSRDEVARLAGGRPAADLMTAAFRFLLDREPRQSILRRFELSVIGHYFPDFEQALPAYLNGV